MKDHSAAQGVAASEGILADGFGSLGSGFGSRVYDQRSLFIVYHRVMPLTIIITITIIIITVNIITINILTATITIIIIMIIIIIGEGVEGPVGCAESKQLPSDCMACESPDPQPIAVKQLNAGL